MSVVANLRLSIRLPCISPVRVCFALMLLTLFLGNGLTSRDAFAQTAIGDQSAAPAETKTAQLKRVLFLGDSLTEGFGLESRFAYPAVIARKIAQAKLPYEVINAGISGDTSMGGLQRIDWLLKSPVDVLVLALGANDGLRGLNLDMTERNLIAIIRRARERYPQVKILLLGMQVPPNLGAPYTAQFKNLFIKIAAEEKVELLPFLLEGVAGDYNLNQADGIHPTAAGHEIVAENVWKKLHEML